MNTRKYSEMIEKHPLIPVRRPLFVSSLYRSHAHRLRTHHYSRPPCWFMVYGVRQEPLLNLTLQLELSDKLNREHFQYVHNYVSTSNIRKYFLILHLKWVSFGRAHDRRHVDYVTDFCISRMARNVLQNSLKSE